MDHYESRCERTGQAECLAGITPERVVAVVREKRGGNASPVPLAVRYGLGRA